MSIPRVRRFPYTPITRTQGHARNVDVPDAPPYLPGKTFAYWHPTLDVPVYYDWELCARVGVHLCDVG
jgi:hypothetical protein